MNVRKIVKQVLPDKIVSNLNLIYGSLYRKLYTPPKKYILKYAPTYNEDGLYTNHNCDFMEDPLFKEAYDLGFATGSSKGWHMHWRAYIACWLADRAKDMKGDFVECGTNRGLVSRAVVHYTNFGELPKKFYLMDTFCGLFDEYQSGIELKRRNFIKYEECYDDVKKTFAEFDNVILIRGVIPKTLPMVQTKKISFLHIDMNCAAPEIAAGEYFWDKLVKASPLLLDDYAYPGFHEQKIAWDAFAKRKRVKVLTLPTGQGLILKP